MTDRTRPSGSATAATLVNGFDLLLRPGESVLWTGAPDLRTWLRRSWTLKALWVWIGAILLVSLLTGGAGASGPQLAWMGVVALVGTASIVLTDLWICRTTRYLITDRRVAMRMGLALPGTANIPLDALDGASVRRFGDGSGDIALKPDGPLGVGYFILWPHTRPWRVNHPEPTLRALPNVEEVAELLRETIDHDRHQ